MKFHLLSLHLEGVCLGMQLAVVEFSRNVLGWQDANSTEFDPNTNHPVVIDMPEHNPGQMGGTMRLGKRRTLFQTKNSVMSKSGLPPAQPAGCTSRCYSQPGIYSFVLTSEVLYFFPSDIA